MPSPCRTLATSLLLLAALAAWPASAQIRRCTTDDGSHVYTDRECKDIGAIERAPRIEVAGQGGRIIRRDCSRNVQDLVFELTAAIDSKDVNRLAGIYHWPGTSSRNAYAIMGRLDAIVNRPLVDITPLQPPPPPSPVAPAPQPLAWQTVPHAAAAQNPNAPAPAAPVPEDELPDAVKAAATRQQHTRRAPTGLVVDQTVANRITPLQTVFSLRRHLDCWWVSL
ncbi:hypothetical protein FQY83_07015 [Luteimonas marina]|uniref:DUF4124 domain-containing protein n=1 Tax=Luteimonas marina TaxID=488485 RepID=A0A5C5U4X7_9GAMM|nr:hypothetical protein [Luteimonas marina]TWT21107.1 hypothetical protein FQY83_07015 [Luteimonas marina]